MQHQIDPKMQECIEQCLMCHDICLQTLKHCLTRGGAHAEPAHITLMQDCIQICQTSRDFMLRGSALHGYTCRACAEICTRCADDCMKLAGDDQHMKACADTCQRCARLCKQMSA